MGDRYVLRVVCFECGHVDDNCWYAPTCDVRWWVCPRCGSKIDLEVYSGITESDASNRDKIERVAEGLRVAAVELRESVLWPVAVVDEIQNVMMEGERAGKNNKGWSESVEHHVDRAIVHLARLGHDDEEDHLAHAFARLMMACAIERGYVGQGTKEKAFVKL